MMECLVWFCELVLAVGCWKGHFFVFSVHHRREYIYESEEESVSCTFYCSFLDSSEYT